MEVKGKRILVTGGAGFIGSHLCDRLVDASSVTVYDNLSSGSLDNIKDRMNNRSFRFVQGDMLDADKLEKPVDDAEFIFHLAANPEVPVGVSDTQIDLTQNVLATHKLLECMRKSRSVKRLVFASTSTVYGEADFLPTPESYGPLRPISLYGATKLACEAMISAYANLFGFSHVTARLANIVGPRAKRGVIVDFIRKLHQNPSELEILGDGTQTKSYLTVEDCVDALVLAAERAPDSCIVNVGSDDAVDVFTIARIVANQLGLQNVRYRASTEMGGRGWPGDVKKMLLANGLIKSLGWVPRYSKSEDSIRVAVQTQLTS